MKKVNCSRVYTNTEPSTGLHPYTQAEPLLELNNCRDFSTFASSISSSFLPPFFGWLKWFKETLRHHVFPPFIQYVFLNSPDIGKDFCF